MRNLSNDLLEGRLDLGRCGEPRKSGGAEGHDPRPEGVADQTRTPAWPPICKPRRSQNASCSPSAVRSMGPSKPTRCCLASSVIPHRSTRGASTLLLTRRHQPRLSPVRAERSDLNCAATSHSVNPESLQSPMPGEKGNRAPSLFTRRAGLFCSRLHWRRVICHGGLGRVDPAIDFANDLAGERFAGASVGRNRDGRPMDLNLEHAWMVPKALPAARHVRQPCFVVTKRPERLAIFRQPADIFDEIGFRESNRVDEPGTAIDLRLRYHPRLRAHIW